MRAGGGESSLFQSPFQSHSSTPPPSMPTQSRPRWSSKRHVTSSEAREGPLPPFALLGAPGPHEIVAPPDVPHEPSHGGAARAPTAVSTLKETALTMQTSVKAFQLAASLDQDGDPGPMTRATYLHALA